MATYDEAERARKAGMTDRTATAGLVKQQARDFVANRNVYEPTQAPAPRAQQARPVSPFTAPGSTLAPPAYAAPVTPVAKPVFDKRPAAAATPVTAAPVRPAYTPNPTVEDWSGDLPAQAASATPTTPDVNPISGKTYADPMGMTSIAARNMGVRFDRAAEDQGRAARGGSFTENALDPRSVEGMASRAKWEAARESAMEGAMSPEAYRRYQQDKDRRRMETVENTKSSATYVTAQQAADRDVAVAKEQGGAKSAEQAQMIGLRRDEMALREKGDAQSLAQADRLAQQRIAQENKLVEGERSFKSSEAEQARKDKQYEVIGNQITRLLTAQNADPVVIAEKVAKLEAQQAKIMGFDVGDASTATPALSPAAKVAASVNGGGTVNVRGPSGAVQSLPKDQADKFLKLQGYSLAQ